MGLTNAEKQSRWREKHIGRRRDAQRIVNLLMRRQRSEEHLEQIGYLLRTLLTTREMAGVRRGMRGLTPKEMEAHHRERWKAERDAWLREHPGRTAAEYSRLLRDHESEVCAWRRVKGRESVAQERADWERDHPCGEYPEHECSLSDREYSDLSRWRRNRQRGALRTALHSARNAQRI